MTSFLNGRVCLHEGDCLDVVRTLAASSIDAVVTDPPYGLEFMGREWDAPWQSSSKSALFGNRERPTPGWATTRNPSCTVCHGRLRGAKVCSCGVPTWDEAPTATNLRQMRWFQEWCEDWAREVLRVLKPGGHMVAFSGTRTYHRMACAIEDAGFEIRDQLAWVYGQGFPKSLDVSKGIDEHFFGEWLNDDPSRLAAYNAEIDAANGDAKGHVKRKWRKVAGVEREVVGANRWAARVPHGTVGLRGNGFGKPDETAPATDAARQWEGWGTALKPAWEPICLARKPLSEPTVAANVLRWGMGAINVDACRVGTDGGTKGCDAGPSNGILGDGLNGTFGKLVPGLGRWPANLCHDGSDEVLDLFPESKGQAGAVTGREPSTDNRYVLSGLSGNHPTREPRGDSGSAARFFYSAKADGDQRLGSKHPTVKPVDLLQWLVRMVTPPGGTVLDPFSGTGTTGEAAWREGFSAVLIEREAEYCADIARRMELALASGRERAETIVKVRGMVESAGPLFDF